MPASGDNTRRQAQKCRWVGRRVRVCPTLVFFSILLGAGNARGESVVPVRLVDGQVCARGVIAGEKISIPANIVIDLGSRGTLLVHERTAKLLGLVRHTPVKLTLGEVVMPALPAVPLGIKALEDLTRDFAAELGELPAVAVLGLPAFEGFMPQLDLGDGVLRLFPAGNAEEVNQLFPKDLASSADATIIPYREEGWGVWLTGVGPDDFAMRVQFSTAIRDTIIDATVTDLLGAAGGELDRVLVGSMNLARFVALRPQDLTVTPEPHPDLVLGTDLLSSWRVTVDTAGKRMLFEAVRSPEFPVSERAFYVARADEDADAVEALLPDGLPGRLANEAADWLIGYRLEEYPIDAAAFERAVRLKVSVDRPERRAATMVMLADHLLSGELPNRLELASAALAVAEPHAAEDLNARAIHDIHARQGLIALERDDLKAARRHLLSATFGLPRDPQVHLALGRFYERTGKYARAWSRYAQAAISDDAPVAAFEGLDRLNRLEALRKNFSMRDAEQLLEGRVIEFHPARRWNDRDAAATGVRLIELFSCVDHPPTLAAELAFGALTEYFEGADVALVEYHLATPALDPLVSDVSAARAGFYKVEAMPTALFDGANPIDEGGDEAAAEPLFARYLQTLAQAKTRDDRWRLTADARFAGKQVVGQIGLDGPESPPEARLIVLLCERLVMATGANGLVLHRNVCRHALSPPGGFAVPAAAGKRRFSFAVDGAEIQAALDGALARIESEQDITFVMKPTYVDYDMCSAILILQDSASQSVLCAGIVDLAAQGDSH